MTTYVILVVNATKLYPNIDPFIPQPAMGNMLPTTKGYDEKFQEKLFKIQSELVADPLFAYPTDVTIQFIGDPGSDMYGPKKSYNTKTLLDSAELRVSPKEVFPGQYTLTGVNPYVDRALMTSYLAKNKTELPFWLNPKLVEVLDVWKLLTGTSDWRTAASLWNLPKDPVDATSELLKRL